MVTLLLWFLMVADSFQPGVQAFPSVYPRSKPTLDMSNLAQLGEMAKTRFLVCFLKKGMTWKEVAKILGNDAQRGMFSTKDSYFHYPSSGVSVRYTIDNADTFFYRIPWRYPDR